jgi:hypothetical protein
MSKFTFNGAKGAVRYYAGLPGANDALVAVAIESSGIEADATMITRSTLAAVLAASTNEQTTVGRKALTGVTITTDSTANTVTITCDAFTYALASGSAIGAILVCYVPDTTAGGLAAGAYDSNVVPMWKFDFSAIPSGADIPVQVSTNGLAVISDAS